MSDTTKNALISGIVFGAVMGIVMCFIGGVSYGVVAGIASGVLFGLSIAVISRKLTGKFTGSRSEMVGSESVIMEGPANHFKGMEGVGGWLLLTAERLVFKSHSVNLQKHEWAAHLDEISEVAAVKTYGLIPNGLQIVMSDGGRERFVVNRSTVWAEKIGEAVKHEKG